MTPLPNPRAFDLRPARRALDRTRAFWRAGLTGDACEEAHKALAALLTAWAPRDTDDTSEGALRSGWDAVVRAGYRPLRDLDEGPVAGDALACERLWSEAEALLRFTERFVQSPSMRRRRQLVQLGFAAVSVALVVLVAAHVHGRPTTSASAALSPDFGAELATDNRRATEWLLPDGQTGWLEVTFAQPRPVARVRIFNAHNRFFLDRASEQLRVTAYSRERAVATAEAKFDELRPTPTSTTVELAAHDVTHIRVEVLSFFGRGGGLAEVEVY